MTHDEIRESLAAYAFSEGSGQEIRIVEEHLTSCQACRAELGALLETMAALAESVPQADPPAALKSKILAGAKPKARRGAQLLAAATTIVVLALGGKVALLSQRNQALESELAAARLKIGKLDIDLEQRKQLLSVLGPGAHIVALEGAEKANVRLLMPGSGLRGALVGDLPLPKDGLYQVWTIADGKPASVGLIYPKSDQTAVVLFDMPASGGQAVAVTWEKGPDASPVPTSDPLWSIKI